MVVTSDSLLHIRSNIDLSLRQQIVLFLFRITEVTIYDYFHIIAGDEKGKIEYLRLKPFTLERDNSTMYIYHNNAIEKLKVFPKKSIGTAFYMASYARGCFALWNSADNSKPVSVFYCWVGPHPSIFSIHFWEENLMFLALFSRGNRLVATKHQIVFPDFSSIYIAENAAIVESCLERKWKAIQYVSKVQPNYTALDQPKFQLALKQVAEKPIGMMHPYLIEALYPGSRFSISAGFDRISLLCYLQVLSLIKGERGKQLSDEQEVDTGDKMMNLLAKMICVGKQAKELLPVGYHPLADIDSGAMENKIKYETNIYTLELTDQALDNRMKRAQQPQNANPQRPIQINYQKPFETLEHILKEKSDITRLVHIHYKAAEFGTLNYEMKRKNRDGMYSIEQEILFVRKNFDYKFELDDLQYRSAKDLYKKKNWKLIDKLHTALNESAHRKTANRSKFLDEVKPQLSIDFHQLLSPPPKNLFTETSNTESWRQPQPATFQTLKAKFSRLATEPSQAWRIKTTSKSIFNSTTTPKNKTQIGQVSMFSPRLREPAKHSQSPSVNKPSKDIDLTKRKLSESKATPKLTHLQQALKTIVSSPKMMQARYYFSHR
jgi:hypothetical protein